ncbi:MAG TPA: Hsp70 family protein [Arachnia sp.]|nr:Hsp70 family protein [Arachnia sp.]HMT84845.1 Hsp70 family protein [Arachnia sp.]
MAKTIGIDLGTTYSAASVVGAAGLPEMVRNSEGQTITPSVVYFDGDGVLVGQQAKNQRVVAPHDVVEFVKRQMGSDSWSCYTPEGTRYTAEAVSALILKKLAADAEIALGEDISGVVITVPAYFSDAQRLATKQAGEIAGLNVISVINEPTAAALSFAVEQKYNGMIMVYDLGGGTFDVTILRARDGDFDIVHTAGDRNLGGFDFDNAIMAWAKEQFEQRTGLRLEEDSDEAMLRDRSEQAKHRLSSADQAPMFVASQGRNEKLLLTREEFERLTSGLLGRTEMLVEEVIDESGVDPREIDKVLLVGGSTRMPMVREMLQRLTGRTPDQTVHPDEAVARGAAIVSALRGQQGHGSPLIATDHEIVIRDVVSHGLGVVADNEQGISENSIIIPANSTIPCQEAREFYTVVDQQTQLLVQVTEGEDTDLRYVNRLGQSELRIPPHPAHSPVQVIFSCDIDGMLHIEVVDLVDNHRLGEFEIDRAANLDREDVDSLRRDIARVDVS